MIDSFFGKVFYPLEWLATWSHDKAASSVDTMRHLWSADQENTRLREELAQKTVELQRMNELMNERDRLSALFQFKKEHSLPLLLARVIGRDPSLFFRTLEINRGTDDGISETMAVVSPQGVIGKILRTYKTTSTVLLVTDLNSRVDAVVQRSRTRVIVGGTVEGELNLRFLPRRFDLREGDEIVTSGFGGFFPPGFKIGVVVGLAKDPHFVLEQAALEASVDFESLEEVFVVQTLARWP